MGVKAKEGVKSSKIENLSKREILMINIGSTTSGAEVIAIKNNLAKLKLNTPVCTEKNEKIALSRRIDKHWRLIGYGLIRKGLKINSE